MCLALLAVIVVFSVPTELCKANLIDSCFTNPCSLEGLELSGSFCPVENDIICGEGTNYIYYAYKLLFALFIDFIVLMRASSIFKFEKVQIYMGFAIVGLHFSAIFIFTGLSCDIRLIEDSCRDILGF